MTNMKHSIGLRIKRLRSERKLTQEVLAERCGVSTRAISNIERGGNFPSFENLVAIAETLKCQLSDILDAPAKGASRSRIDAEAKLIAMIKSLPNDKVDIAVKFLSSLS